jgi:hypothetical protein
MSLTAKFNVSRKTLLLVSLLTVVLVSSLFVCVFMNGPRGASLENAVHVKNETTLKNAINRASSKESFIALDTDIILTDKLVIPANKDITLTSSKVAGYCKLIGAESRSTIFVEGKGVLRLDGVIVTHPNHRGPQLGGGVYVAKGGQFILYSGEISGNCAIDVGDPHMPASAGGGVYNLGVFEMYGGKISNNHVSTTGSSGAPGGGCGAGVCTHGPFTMFGGEITNNNAHVAGGGVYSTDTFTMSGGKIADNSAENWGGGVCASGVFERLGGVITGNTAPKGNNVYPNGDGGGSSNVDNGTSVDNGNSFGGDFSLRDVVIICVGVAVVIVGVVVAVLLFTFKKELEYTRKKEFSSTDSTAVYS